MSCCIRSIMAGSLLAAAAFAWPLASSANPYFAQQTGQPCTACHQPGQESAGLAGLNPTGQSFRACGEQPSCLRAPYSQQQYGQQPYQPNPQPSYQQPYPQQPYGQQPYQPNTQLPAQAGSRRFDNPTVQGIIVDTCVTWANDCGRGGATQFCRQQGFRSALSWSTFYPGRTYVIGSQQVCTGTNCGGFQSVVCGN